MFTLAAGESALWRKWRETFRDDGEDQSLSHKAEKQASFLPSYFFQAASLLIGAIHIYDGPSFLSLKATGQAATDTPEPCVTNPVGSS